MKPKTAPERHRNFKCNYVGMVGWGGRERLTLKTLNIFSIMVFEMLRLEFYVPRALEDTQDVKKVEELLRRVKDSLKIDVKKFVIDENGEDLKFKILWGLSVTKRIRIKQTRKSKSLYPQLVVFVSDKPITFYPQARAGEEITIKEFLEGLLKGEIRCLHEKFEIEDELKGSRI
jgi:hypothetical protein